VENELKKLRNQYGNEIKKLEKDNKEALEQLERIKTRKSEEALKYVMNVNQEPTKFYDVILDVESLKALKKGWKIICSDEGKKQITSEKSSCVVGVVGNFDKGKSFFLCNLADFEVPHGFSVQTKGISVKYPSNLKTPVTLLDSAGFETPIKFQEEEEEENKMGEEKKRIGEKEITNKARDRQLTELFMQKFIIENSNILLMVVGVLTYSDQKLLNRLKRFCKNKKLFVIHNLANFLDRKQVENYIQNTLLKTLKLTKNNYIIFEEDVRNPDHKEQNDSYFVEESLLESYDSKENGIVHLILANNDSSAGDYYNPSTFAYIKNQIKSYTNLKPFNVIKSLRSHLFNMSKELFEKAIEKTDEIIIEEGTMLKYSNKNDITLRKCLIDELGYSSFANSTLTPKHQLYIDQKNRKLILVLEIPDLDEYIVEEPDIIDQYRVFKVTGIKSIKSQAKLENDEVYFLDKGNLESGEMVFQLQVPFKEADISGKEPVDDYKDGILTIIYELKEMSKPKRTILKK